MATKNSLMYLNLYKNGTTWAFDDDKFDIINEPFVLGMSEIISYYTDKQNCEIIFGKEPFPNSKSLTLLREEANGGWYLDEESQMTGWLCPVTRIYYNNTIPEKIYFQVK